MNDLASKIFQKAQQYQDEAVALLRRLISTPGPSHSEGPRLELLQKEVERTGAAERTFMDSYGNLCWTVGQGDHTILLCGHADTAGPGPMEAWKALGIDPHEGHYDSKGRVWGRGAVCGLAGLVTQVFATRIIKELGLGRNVSVYAVATVSAEENPGGGLRWIFNEGVRSNLYPRPEVVLLAEATGDSTHGPLGIYRGHRGHMEIVLETQGKATHGATPWRGVNAIAAMGPIITELQGLQEGQGLINDPALGRGSITITRIEDGAASTHSVPASCRVVIDRRLTFGETRATAMAQILNLPSVRALGDKVQVRVRHHDTPTWKSYRVNDDQCHMAWATPSDHAAIKAAHSTYNAILTPRANDERYTGLFAQTPREGCWKLGTDGFGIPSDVPALGLGAGIEELAHTAKEHLDARELVGAVAFTALYPTMYRLGRP